MERDLRGVFGIKLGYIFIFHSLVSAGVLLLDTKSWSVSLWVSCSLFVLLYICALFCVRKRLWRYLCVIASYTVIYWGVSVNEVDFVHFNNFACLVPMLYIYVCDCIQASLLITLANVYMYSTYDLTLSLYVDYIVKLAFAYASQVVIFKLIFKFVEEKERFRQLSISDELTGLLNRRGFMERSKERLCEVRENKGKAAIIFIDLDRFKTLNDNFGHGLGDKILTEMANRLRKIFGEKTPICRLGGDEFLIYVECEDKCQANELMKKLTELIAQTFYLNGLELTVSASMGISFYPGDGESIDELMQNADSAMYFAKRRGENYLFYSKKMCSKRTKIMEHDLLRALRQNEFYLVYQPQIDLRTDQLIGVEALIRWEHPEYGLISPGDFIGLAEESKLIVPIGTWVLREACRQNKQWQNEGYEPIKVAVNVSVYQFLRPEFVEIVRGILLETGMAPEYLIIEIVENVFASQSEISIKMAKLKDLGINIAIDDFGSGYASFSYIKEFPIDLLKIDRSFIGGIAYNQKDETIIATIISMAHFLNISVVAEGVEREQELRYLRQNKCDYVQGFYTGKPCLNEEIEQKYLQDEECVLENIGQVAVGQEVWCE